MLVDKQSTPDRVSAGPDWALHRACERLLTLQHPEGWWKGELQTNVTMDAEDLLLREFLGIREPGATSRSAAWIRSQQRQDGSWSTFWDGPGDLSTTIEAYLALRLAGDPADASHMRAAAEFARGHGGIEAARVFTHIWLALFGQWPWQCVPALPPEMLLLPPWVPLNVYDFACWARQTIVALSVVMAYRPCRALPFARLDELHGARPWTPPRAHSARGRVMLGVDRLLRIYQRWPLPPLRKLALARAESWIVDRQEADGSWGGIQPPWVYSLIALHLRGYPLDHAVIRRGLKGLESFMIDDGATRRLEACQSPVWDTALALQALADAGRSPEEPALVQASTWLLDQEVTSRGDWAIRRPRVPAGGWAFEFANVNYPDVDDTAVVALALHNARGRDEPRLSAATERALEWVEGMQSRDGGWGAFDADNSRAVVRDLPFCDFGEVIDPPSADVTAHAVEMLAALGRGGGIAAQRGVEWLLADQRPDGSWFGRWGVNHVYGTGAVLPALVRAGIAPDHLAVRRAVRWLEQHQNEDGGWGEDPVSYDDPKWIGHGPSTASQTAWALLALHAAGEHSRSMERGVTWLAATQLADGGWDEPHFTGTGFPGDFYINYHLYRLVFPTMALARCRR